VDWSYLAQDRDQWKDSCEHGNEHSGSVHRWEIPWLAKLVLASRGGLCSLRIEKNTVVVFKGPVVTWENRGQSLLTRENNICITMHILLYVELVTTNNYINGAHLCSIQISTPSLWCSILNLIGGKYTTARYSEYPNQSWSFFRDKLVNSKTSHDFVFHIIFSLLRLLLTHSTKP
jgi:hypothetical protein